MTRATREIEAEARDFVRRYAAAVGLNADNVWEEHHQRLLELELNWFVNQRNKEQVLEADFQASQTFGRNSPPKIQWPSVETGPAPEPTYLSFADYLHRTTYKQQMARCHRAAANANRKRLLSPRPKHALTGADIWNLIETALGRCSYCGSLAIESRPSKPNGAPALWAQVGRRIGSLEHRNWRALGGDNDLNNLAWCCLWCNDWPGDRKAGALDHGGFYPPPEDITLIEAMLNERKSVPTHRTGRINQNKTKDDDYEDEELYQWPYMSSGEPR